MKIGDRVRYTEMARRIFQAPNAACRGLDNTGVVVNVRSTQPFAGEFRRIGLSICVRRDDTKRGIGENIKNNIDLWYREEFWEVVP